jgi:hypothetical protein
MYMFCKTSNETLFDRIAEFHELLYKVYIPPTLGLTQPPIQWESAALSLGVRRPGPEADHSPPSSAEVKTRGAIPPLPNTSSWRGA